MALREQTAGKTMLDIPAQAMLRPEFMVLTGNDLAIDMVMYGSDYLLELNT